mgnify:CR=1 FL=1
MVDVSFEHFTRRTFDTSDDFDAGVAEHVCEVVVDPAGDNGADARSMNICAVSSAESQGLAGCGSQR